MEGRQMGNQSLSRLKRAFRQENCLTSNTGESKRDKEGIQDKGQLNMNQSLSMANTTSVHRGGLVWVFRA